MLKKVRRVGCLLLLAAICATVLSVWVGCRRQGAQSVTAVDGKVERERYVRVLVAGVDRTSGLSDVLMLVSLDRERNEAWILQIPRDTYAAYTNRSYKKLNGAPQTLGSMEQTCRFLSEAMGIEIDRYVRLSPDVLRDAVDAVGGVEIELDRTMYYNDPEQGLSIHLKKGKQTLDGEQAEQLVRYRWGYARGDLDRMDVQKRFLSSFLRTARQELSLPVAIRLAGSLWGEVETDLKLTELPTLIGEAMALSEESIFLVTAPGSEAVAKSGASYYALSAPAMEELLSEHFGMQEGAFDRKSVFLNDQNRDFQKIYETYVSYRVYCAAESE